MSLSLQLCHGARSLFVLSSLSFPFFRVMCSLVWSLSVVCVLTFWLCICVFRFFCFSFSIYRVFATRSDAPLFGGRDPPGEPTSATQAGGTVDGSIGDPGMCFRLFLYSVVCLWCDVLPSVCCALRACRDGRCCVGYFPPLPVFNAANEQMMSHYHFIRAYENPL
jgi:hypothetical protein